MLKRTKGRLLLTLLVITGLAGTINNTAISGKERKMAASLMKETRSDVLQSIKGLSDDQLSFKSAGDRWSIKECVYHIAVSEKAIWQMLEGAMKAPANPDKRSEIKFSDEEVIKRIENREHRVKTFETLEPKNTPYKSLEEALNDFKTTRNDHIKYIKTTTEDLRNHVVETPLGWIDCYQLVLFMAGHSNRHTQQINEVKTEAGFPKK